MEGGTINFIHKAAAARENGRKGGRPRKELAQQLHASESGMYETTGPPGGSIGSRKFLHKSSHDKPGQKVSSEEDKHKGTSKTKFRDRAEAGWANQLC